MAKKSLLSLAFALLLVGCGSALEREVALLDRLLRWNQIGSGTDYWLVKYGVAGRDPVGVIFGFVDDREFCQEVADMYRAKYRASNLYCEPVK